MNSKKLLYTIFILIFLFSLTLTTKHFQCKVCYTQKYERSIFFIPIRLISEYEYNEFYTHFKKESQHEHNFLLLEKCYILFGCKVYNAPQKEDK